MIWVGFVWYIISLYFLMVSVDSVLVKPESFNDAIRLSTSLSFFTGIV